MWVGADFDGGLARLKNGRVTRYTNQAGLSGGGLHVMHEDASGNLWLGASRGLFCLRAGTFVTNDLTERMSRESVRDICEDHAGGLWFATENGLNYWRNGQFSHFDSKSGLSDNMVIALFEDANNTLWVGYRQRRARPPP